MQKQEIFDKVWDHFVTQGKPSAVKGNRCAYRTEDGCACAVGILIPDELYDPRIEGKNVFGAFGVNSQKMRELEKLLGFSGNGNFLSALQSAHDSAALEMNDEEVAARAASPEEFRKEVEGRLRDVALRFHLKAPLTPQFILDEVWRHFIVEKNRASVQITSTDYSPTCLYRDGKGNKCAVGIFIPDELYEPKMETAVQFLLLDYSSLREIFQGISAEFLRALQRAHDTASFAEGKQRGFYRVTDTLFRQRLRKNLKQVAADYKLELPA